MTLDNFIFVLLILHGLNHAAIQTYYGTIQARVLLTLRRHAAVAFFVMLQGGPRVRDLEFGIPFFLSPATRVNHLYGHPDTTGEKNTLGESAGVVARGRHLSSS